LTCLLAELLEAAGNSIEADALLKGPAGKGDTLALGEQVRLCTLRGEWPAAAAATRRLLDLRAGGRFNTFAGWRKLYERDGRIDEALKWIETWKRLSPGATTPWLNQARLLRYQGNETELLKTLRKAIQRFDQDDELRVATRPGLPGDWQDERGRTGLLAALRKNERRGGQIAVGQRIGQTGAHERDRPANWSRISASEAVAIGNRLSRCSPWRKSIERSTIPRTAGNR